MGVISRLKKDFKNIKQLDRKLTPMQLSIAAWFLKSNAHLVNPNDSPLNQYKTWFKSLEFSVCSQNGEDGIIAEIFKCIGIKNFKFIEFGVGDGTQCNTVNLLKHFGWQGLWLEIDEAAVQRARENYSDYKLVIDQVAVTKENINELFTRNGFEGEVDLLSIDIDGNDYWVWREIEVVQPRVVVIEYNSVLSRKEAVTIPYDPNFNRYNVDPSGIYHGMSLPAAVMLGKEKNYRYVGCDSVGVNAIFIRRDIEINPFKEVSAVEFQYDQLHRSMRYNSEAIHRILARHELIKV